MVDKSRTRATVIAVAVGAIVLIGGPAQAAGTGWTAVPSPSDVPGDNYLYGSDATDASNVWAVGGVRPPTGGNYHGLVMRYDGTAWRSVARTGLPGNESLQDVDAVSSTDVWVIGDHRGSGFSTNDTLAAHWNGTAWTVESTPNGGGFNNLYGVAAAGGTVWAVGSYVDPSSSGNRLKLILQRTGGTWRIAAAPRVAADERLAAVDATGSADAWAVGSSASSASSSWGPLALHWNGSSWVSATVPAPPGTWFTGVDARTPSDVWVVGSTLNGSTYQPYAAHFNGTSWGTVATPTLSGGGELADVAALSPSSVVAVGRSNNAALIMRWNGTAWTQEATPSLSNPYITGVVAAGGTVWATGYRFELNAYANRTLTMLGP